MKIYWLNKKLLFCLLAFPAASFAQEVVQEQVDCAVEENKKLKECINLNNRGVIDEVVTTGTYLKRDKFTSPSPIEVITAADIEQAGSPSIGEFIRDLSFTLNSNTINNIIDTGGSGGDRQNGSDTSINLRGFGTDGTVTLVNGVRASTALDANGLVPDIGIQQAEILLDGGGALYGADAIAGVVNFITIKKYDGVKLKLYHTGDDGGDYGDSKLSLLAGKSFGNLDVVSTFETQHRTALSNYERPQYMEQAIGFSTTANPGRFTDSFSRARVDTGCGANVPGGNFSEPGKRGFAPTGLPILDATTLALVGCGFAYDEHQDYIPEMDRHVSNTNFLYTVNENLSLEYNLALQWRETTTRTSPHLGGSMSSMRIYPSHANFPSNLAPGPFSTYLLAAGVRPFGKLGTRPSDYNGDGSRDDISQTSTYNHTIAANYNIGDSSWSGTTYGSSSRRRSISEELVIRDSRMAAALQGLGGPGCSFDSDTLIGLDAAARQTQINTAVGQAGMGSCGYFNPFSSALLDPGQANDQELVDWLVVKDNWNSGSTETRTWETRVSGELFDLPAGPVAMAIGHNYRELTYTTGESTTAALDDNLNGAGFNYFFSEVVQAEFVEFSVPVLDNVFFSAAARREEYTDRPFGSVTKPKFSISYNPTEDLVFRASYSESFTAPRADELDSGSLLEFNLSSLTVDPFYTGTTSGPGGAPGPNGVPHASELGGQLIISGNPELKPEETETINVGFTYRGLEDWTFSLDLQEIQYFDRVVSLSRAELLERELNQFTQSGGDINNQADVLAFFAANPNPEIPRDPTTGGILDIFQRPSNADNIIARFLDLKVENRLSTDWGYFNTILTATAYDQYLYQDEVSFEEFDAVAQRNRDISAARAIPRWKGNLVVRWLNGNHSISGRVDHIAGVQFDGSELTFGSVPPDEIKAFTTMDLRYTYAFAGLLNGSMELTFGGNNIFDREAQKLPIAGGFESRLQDPYGRRLYVEATYDF